MPLELTRRTPGDLDAEAYISPGEREQVEWRSIIPPRSTLTLPPFSCDAGEEEVTGTYLRALRSAGRRGRVICVELLGGAAPQVDLKCAVRASSIILREREASIIICVPRREDTREFEHGELAQYISQRYTGASVQSATGNVFEKPLYRAFPNNAPPNPAVRAGGASFTTCSVGSAAPQAPKTAHAPGASGQTLDELLKGADAGFSETLMRLIDKTGEKDSAIYKRANVDRKLFSKIRSNPGYRPSKTTALAFAVALRLDLDGTRDLLSRAGYALNPASRADIIVEFFISRGHYDIYDINERLFAYDEPILGGAG